MTLTSTEKLIVKGTQNYSNENSMLNDNHIHIFNNILQSCTIFNMQSSLLIQTPHLIEPVPNDNKYVQILFSGNYNKGHWICIYYENQIIHVYDSMNNKTLDNDHKIFLKKLFPQYKILKIAFETVQMQENAYDCGVFSIAFAVSIAFNLCPCNLIFDYSQLRTHLLNIFENNVITMFPTLNKYITNDLNINMTSNSNNSNFPFCSKFEIKYLNFNDTEMTLLENNMKQKIFQIHQKNKQNSKNRIIINNEKNIATTINNNNEIKNTEKTNNYDLFNQNFKEKINVYDKSLLNDINEINMNNEKNKKIIIKKVEKNISIKDKLKNLKFKEMKEKIIMNNNYLYINDLQNSIDVHDKSKLNNIYENNVKNEKNIKIAINKEEKNLSTKNKLKNLKLKEMEEKMIINNDYLITGDLKHNIYVHNKSGSNDINENTVKNEKDKKK